MASVTFSDSYRNPKFSTAPTNYIRVDFTEVEYDLVNNRTKVRLDGVYVSTSAGYIGSSVAYGTLSFNGTQVLSMNGGSYQVQLSTSYSYISSSGTGAVVWIPLNDDGSGSMSVSLTGGTPNADNRSCFGVKNTTYGVFGIRTTETKSVALTKRPRITTVSATDAYIGDPVTITLSRYNSSFTHTVKVSCAGNTETLMTKGSTYPTLTWTPALATYAPLITNAMAATATIVCETYNGDTLLGQSTATCTLTLKTADVAPSVSIAATDPTGNLTAYGKFVKGKSKITVTLTPTLAYGATLATTQITANGASYTSSPATTDFILSASNTGITATIRDSRGQTATASATIQIYDYDAPKINAFSAHRCNADGTENNAGAYMAVGYSVEVAPLGNQNAKTLTVKYKKISASTWSTATITLSSYTETGTSQPIAVDTNSTYNVQLVLADDFGSATAELALPTASTRMNWGAGENGGIAIGKVNEYDKTLEIADDWEVQIGGDLHVGGDLSLDNALPVSSGGTGADNAADARDNLGLGNAAIEDIVPVSEGGTGADNAADARTNLGAAPMPTVIIKNTSLSGSNYLSDATYTVSGSGVVIVCASIVSYANDYGQYTAAIYHNGTLIMGAGTRYETSNAAGFGAAAAAPIVVANGDKIRIALQNTKAGAKSVFRRFLCFGCTVS